ncbi:penicillin-binding protein [Roseibium aquae]|uniref:Penicillin-binding protein n=1 Tax=Roseibium aquae TaxID=1323746 RepID=A0A916TBT7_9HYPH|nr:D-alanyl-D-alanine carboxypeptidase family protein [Roseibium aquae]GGB37648.1 penicillin-binding protein [Roseibium aquae]
MPSLRCSIAVTAAVLILFVAPVSATPSLVVDMDTRTVLHAEDAGHPWYPASTAKLMTALVTFQAVEQGDITLKTPVVISKQAARFGASNSVLEPGTTMTLEDALYALLVASANDVAVALAETVAGSEAAFVERMNGEAQRLGLTATRFANVNGLHHPSQQTTARDLALLSLDLYQRYPAYHAMFRTSEVVMGGKTAQSFNTLLTRFPGTVGLKTGFVCSSGRNIVAIAERDGRQMLAVVLGATTGREREERAAKLMTEAFAGELQAAGPPLETIANRPEIAPEDMRLRLCSNQTPPYEARQEARYPWGLPGQASYLTEPSAPVRHVITTWQTDIRPAPPRPAPKPALADRGPVSTPDAGNGQTAAPKAKPAPPASL